MVWILHMADMHLDAPFTSRMPLDVAKLRRSEQREVFSQIIDMAKSRADIMVISGDLFDSRNVSAETLNFLKRKFGEISSVPVFISAGNHDPFSDSSVYNRESLGDNVHIFSCGGEFFDLDDLGVRVAGASFASEDGSGLKRPADFPKHGEYANILVIHGDALSGEVGGRYNGIRKDELESSGFDYVALGHIHSFSGIERAGETLWAYPGIPEPRGFDEISESGVIVGQVGRGETELKLLSVAKRRYGIIEAELPENVGDNETVVERIGAEIEKSGRDILRIILKGRTQRGFRPDLQLIHDRVKDKAFYIEIKDETKAEYDLNAAENDNSLRAVYIRMMNERLRECKAGSREYNITEMALRFGLDAMENKG